ncbi:HlyD family efflux transporter periplasmic adaptor subunit [Acidithiobacillus sp. HP-6]|uniref:efflux RND transporter periplasmic adaptor subunit n=1 Tax=Acidithiobacillus sp. HP-6 TaxID=2697655 RepID=UPI00187A4C20|nr:efflux RND transporter periplasmic adaptor subunit [Acidithiobacillus sp. HP-6]MBE7562770.1 HlyD family efflux transporter periplasmic adaptor subunit [Acidithiobacillus sp. HP-6]
MSQPEDVPLPLETIRQRRMRTWLIVVLVIEFVLLAAYSITLWDITSGRSVSAKNLQLGTVRQGTFPILIRSPGTLEPRIERWVTSNVGGTVQRLFVHPGSRVNVNSPLLSLSNPKVLVQARKAQYVLTRTIAQQKVQKATMDDQLYALEGQLATYKTQADSAEMRLKADLSLLRESVISRLQYETDQLTARNSAELVASMKRRILAFRRSYRAQLQGEQSMIASARTALLAAQADVAALQPKAGMSGEVQTVSVQAGARLKSGGAIARIANIHTLNVILSVSPEDAGEIARGQEAEVRLSIPEEPVLHGAVQRVSPKVVHGEVPVTIRLHGKLPQIARPQLPVTVVIRAGQLAHALYVATPEGAREDREGKVYVLSQGGHKATRRLVHFGLASSAGIQILSGLKAGERIVLSGTPHWDETMKIRP